MLPPRLRGRLAVAAWLALAGGAACDPSPTFPAPTQPLVGTVAFEREVTMGTAPIEVKTDLATLHIDPGTVPVGTKIVVRIVDGIVKELTPATAGDIWSLNGQPLAVQLVSEAKTFARPVLLSTFSFFGKSGLANVLHADEGAAAWTVVGQATTPPPPSIATVTAELTEPHLWTLAMPSPAQIQPPSGVFRLDQLTCGATNVVPTPMEILEIDTPRYTWTRGPIGDACTPIERGQVVFQFDLGFATFAPDYGQSYYFNIQLAGPDAFGLQNGPARPLECPANSPTSLSFVRAVDPVDAGAPSDASDGGCASDAGGSGDAQGG
jgi:hypothetical protein